MTQALALEQMLVNNGHEVCGMVIGTCQRRSIPNFFQERTQATVFPVESPNFYFDKGHKSIRLWKTFYKNVLQIPKFLKEVWWIHKLVKKQKPDVIINFYDVLGGYYFLLANPNVKRLCVAHQYLASHSVFPWAEGHFIQKTAFKLSNFFTSMNAHKKLALSFDSLAQEKSDTLIVPPLLRNEIRDMAIGYEEFILVYVVNKGYGEEILQWHASNPKVKVLCFWDNYDHEDGWTPRTNITFRHLSDQDFLSAMSCCNGYASTAGFESICEAAYFNKPVMMVPVKGQYEQACNALDAQRAGLGKKTQHFDLSPCLQLINHQDLEKNDFKEWVNKAENIIIDEITRSIPKQKLRRLSIQKKGPIKLNGKSNLLQDHQSA